MSYDDADDDADKQVTQLTLESLTDDDWLDMRKIAIKLYDQGCYKRNMFKCTVAAFCHWLEFTETELAIGEVNEKGSRVH